MLESVTFLVDHLLFSMLTRYLQRSHMINKLHPNSPPIHVPFVRYDPPQSDDG